MTKEFLKDVFICSLSAFGGPEAHYGVFTKQLVEKKGYLSADELLEWMALTSFLPGPSSTQTITAIGYQKGGVKLALLTLMVWMLPVVTFLTGLTFFVQPFSEAEIFTNALTSLGFMALGFLVYGGYKLSIKAVISPLTLVIFLSSLAVTLFLRSFYVFPLVLALSGLAHGLYQRSPHENIEPLKWNRPLLGAIILLVTWGLVHPFLGFNPFLQMTSLFAGYGSLVIGGGNVVIPYMYETLVNTYQWISSETFLAGLGLVQGLPGPMFSFSAWAAALSFTSEPILQGVAGFTGALFLFLPGTLFIFLVAPLWPHLKKSKVLKPALKGIIAGAAGLVVSTAFLLILNADFNLVSGLVVISTIGLLFIKKVPVPLILLWVVGLGVFL